MCIVACKWFPGIGWAGCKNRDRNHIPKISFKHITANGLEILLFWDNNTKYCEGFNSNGVSILSSSLAVNLDAKEITIHSHTPNKAGNKIMKALHCSNVILACMSLIKQKLPGNTVIFDEHACYLLEGSWKPGKYKSQKYAYEIKEIPRNEIIVRANHGEWLPWAGYQRIQGDNYQTKSRISSESRKIIAEYVINKAETPDEMIDGLAGTYIDDPQLNCLRATHTKRMMRTTNQMMIIPSENIMYIRPIQTRMSYNFQKMNNPEHKLWVEILNNRVFYDHEKDTKDMLFSKMNYNLEMGQ